MQADDAVRGAHHHMQLMTDHQHSAAEGVTDAIDLTIEIRDATMIQALGRLIQQQEIRRIQQCTGQQNALELTTGETGDLLNLGTGNAGLQEGMRYGIQRV